MKTIAFLTDVHLNEQFPLDHNVTPGENLKRVLRDVSERNIEEIIFGGDIGDTSSHPEFFDMLKPYKLKLILGNHDQFKEVKKYFNPNPDRAELYYTSEDAYFKCIYLDSSSEVVSNEQLEWLKTELITDKKPIVFIHHPIVELDTPIDKLYPLKNRDLVKSIFTEVVKEIILFCGHYHMNDESTFRNLKQLTNQALSFQIIKNAEDLQIDNLNFGYRILKFEGDTIETELINFNKK